LRLVRALQGRGHVVAMTGDGVNAAPALRQADIGVAMALSGTEVAREAADMVLTDDNFASIAAAVEEGRGVYDNLQKFITWVLPTNGGEASVLVVSILFGLSLPVLPVQILWINMTTAVCLGLALAFEPKESDVMSRPPVPPRAPLIPRALWPRVVLVSMLLTGATFTVFHWQLRNGTSVEAARTAAVGMFVFGEMAYLFACRSLAQPGLRLDVARNPWLWAGIAAMTSLQVAFTYVPGMHDLFGSAPLEPTAWAGVLGASAAVYVAVDLEKRLRPRAAARSWRPGRA
jgi:cation-transporting ATPase F